MELVGRHTECAVLDGLIEAVRAGQSRALVVSGEAGVGKTALLDYLAGQASECRVERAVGVQSEMELPFAALHQLCAPMLEKLQGLPAPQRDALEIAFGMSSGSAPDRFLVGLAVLSLLSEVAEEQPLGCGIGRIDFRRPGAQQRYRGIARPRCGAPGGQRCASAARSRPDRAIGHSGPRSDPCRDSGQPAGIVGAAPWIDSA